MNKSEHIKKKLIQELRGSLGIVSSACEALGISRTTYYKYYKADEQFKEQVDSIGDEAIDFVESRLFELIRKGNVAATIFFLKTKGKKRGYVEKQELDVEVEVEVDRNFTVEFIMP
jgi:predicted DNA-binding transcriptional regulator AlpA